MSNALTPKKEKPMLSLYDMGLMLDALQRPLDPELHLLLADRIDDITACDLGELTHILVIEPGDSEADIIAEVGFSPLIERIDGTRHADPDWDWAEAHNGWWELVYTVGNSGFAYILLVQDAEGVAPDLLDLCRRHASEPVA